MRAEWRLWATRIPGKEESSRSVGHGCSAAVDEAPMNDSGSEEIDDNESLYVLA